MQIKFKVPKNASKNMTKNQEKKILVSLKSLILFKFLQMQ